MFDSLFSNTKIQWLSLRPVGHKSNEYAEWVETRPSEDAIRITSKMKRWAQIGDWTARTPSVKQLTLSKKLRKHGIPIYEAKAYQDRVLFLRSKDRAVVVRCFVKKDDWSTRDERELAAAVKRAGVLLDLLSK